ncbi:MAG: hypothetical protein ACYSOD_04715 [Planctomycetota bacterium]|jgi:hypothetical protein
METAANNENRNMLVQKVISGEIHAEEATIGLARIEVNIFYRKLDRAFQAMNSEHRQAVSDVPAAANRAMPDPNFRFPTEPSMPFRICKTFKALVA